VDGGAATGCRVDAALDNRAQPDPCSRRLEHCPARVSRGLDLILILTPIPSGNAGPAGTIKSNVADTEGQLLKQPNVPYGDKGGGACSVRAKIETLPRRG
jgi:hypothetical protein